MLVSTTNRIHSLNEQAHTFAFDILFARLKQKLANIPRLRVRVIHMPSSLGMRLKLGLNIFSPPTHTSTHQVWETGVTTPLESPRAITDDLPSFSLSPLPYITEVVHFVDTSCCGTIFSLPSLPPPPLLPPCLDWGLPPHPPTAVRAIHLTGQPSTGGCS